MSSISQFGFSFEIDEYRWEVRIVSNTGVVKTIQLSDQEIAWWLPGGAVEIENTKTGERRVVSWTETGTCADLISFSTRSEMGLTNVSSILGYNGCFSRLLRNN